MRLQEFRKYIHNEHDIVCNQKYADTLPYSTHLKFVEEQGAKFINLIPNKYCFNEDDYRASDVPFYQIVQYALIGHDSIEDARMTYNDIVKILDTEVFGNYKAAHMVAEIIYCVTDEKGKNRAGRKNEKYYSELKKNKLAIFVKLSDLAANTLFSKLSGSGMYDKYKKEWPKFKEKLYIEEYREFFEYIEKI